MINAQTKLAAILGSPISQSYSPVMHNAAFRKLGMDCEYLPIECGTEALGDILCGIRRMNFVGFNVTKPLKTEVLRYLDHIDNQARLIGAVNTVKNESGRLIGYNTDGDGFVDSLKAELGFTAADKGFLIIGAGGSARAIGVALALYGADKVLISTRRKEAAAELAECINGVRKCAAAVELTKGEVIAALEECDCIINTSGLGMYPNIEATPVDKSWLRKDVLACDLTYNPGKTRFLADAEEVGAPILNGLGMLVYQGVRAFEIWFGVQAPAADMLAAVNGGLYDPC